MGVYIKGLDMPESCYECAYSIERVGICSITQGGCEWGHNRPPHCPLQPIDDEQVEKMQRELVKAWTVFRSVIKDENHEN